MSCSVGRPTGNGLYQSSNDRVSLVGHRFDYATPIEETVSDCYPGSSYVTLYWTGGAFQMQALHDVVKAGYVRYLGMSSCYAYQCTYRAPTLNNTTH